MRAHPDDKHDGKVLRDERCGEHEAFEV